MIREHGPGLATLGDWSTVARKCGSPGTGGDTIRAIGD
jgi:hypothetical protein